MHIAHYNLIMLHTFWQIFVNSHFHEMLNVKKKKKKKKKNQQQQQQQQQLYIALGTLYLFLYVDYTYCKVHGKFSKSVMTLTFYPWLMEICVMELFSCEPIPCLIKSYSFLNTISQNSTCQWQVCTQQHWLTCPVFPCINGAINFWNDQFELICTITDPWYL